MKPADVEEFFRLLAKDRPAPETELQYSNPYTLLVAVVLSAQATECRRQQGDRAAVRSLPTRRKRWWRSARRGSKA